MNNKEREKIDNGKNRLRYMKIVYPDMVGPEEELAIEV